MSKLIRGVKKFLHADQGATMVEYGLMVALIAVVCIAAVTTLGTNISAKFDSTATSVGAAGGS